MKLENLKFYPKKGLLLLYLIGSYVLATIGFFMSLDTKTRVLPWFPYYVPSFITNPIGLFILIFFGLGACYLLFRVITNRPSVEVDSKGIKDFSNPFSAGFIPLQNIANINAFGDWLSIGLKNYDELFGSFPLWKQYSLRFFRYLARIMSKEDFSGKVFIEKSWLGKPALTAAKEIKNFLEDTHL